MDVYARNYFKYRRPYSVFEHMMRDYSLIPLQNSDPIIQLNIFAITTTTLYWFQKRNQHIKNVQREK